MENIPHNYFAFLSNEVYKSSGYITPSGWTFSRNSNYYDLSKHGYFGAVFRKGDNIIIAHRGTDGFTDLGDDIALYISKSKTEQFNDGAKPFTEAILQDLALEKDISNFNIYSVRRGL